MISAVASLKMPWFGCGLTEPFHKLRLLVGPPGSIKFIHIIIGARARNL